MTTDDNLVSSVVFLPAAPLSGPIYAYDAIACAIRLHTTSTAARHIQHGVSVENTGHSATSNAPGTTAIFTYDCNDGISLLPSRYYYGYRYYSPSLGRWLSRDPVGEKGGVNVYLYVNNNPNNKSDPFGLFSWPDMNSIHLDIQTPIILGPMGIYGLTWITKWSSGAHVDSGDNKWWADADGEAEVKWWAVDEYAQQHEVTHVRIFGSWWSQARSKAGSLVARPGCKPKADCYCSAISAYTGAYLVGAYAENTQIDCDDGNWLACFNARVQRAAYNSLLSTANALENKCARLP